jgi:hypothetical protein
MEILGVVVSIEDGMLGDQPVLQVVVSLEDLDGSLDELVIRVFGRLVDHCRGALQVGSTVVALGVLRLNHQLDSPSNKYFAAPALHVCAPTGSISAIC